MSKKTPAAASTSDPTPANARKPNRRGKPSFACWELIALVVAHVRRLLLFGVPGTGKTHAGMRLGVTPEQAVFSITVTPETPAAELRGHFVPSGDRFVWLDGPAIAAWRSGGRLVLNEIDHAGGDLLSFLLVLLDDPESARINLPNGEVVTPAPGFSVVATMNGEPDALPPALRDRFVATIEVDAVAPGALDRLPRDVRDAACATVALPEERRVSVRAWLEFAELRERTDERIAAATVFGDRAAEVLAALRMARADEEPSDEQ